MARRDSKNILNKKECREIVEKKLQRDSITEFSLVSYEIVPLDETMGALGQYYNLKTIVTDNKSPDVTKIINFFIKLPPLETNLSHNFNQESGIFTKEVDLYTTAFPIIHHGLEKCSIIPECYLGLKDEIIVLEDMTDSEYVMIDKFKSMDMNHCTVVMKALAEFHAKSLIYEVTHGKNISEEFPNCIREIYLPSYESMGKKLYNANIKGLASMSDPIMDLDECSRKKLKKIFLSFYNDSSWLLPSKKFRNVLCHGDLWTNNILFKYNSENDVINCCFVDFQFSRYNPPAHDIWTFLLTTTSRKFRDEHSNQLFKVYHHNLSTSLIEAGIDCATILPWKDFRESLDNLYTTSVINGILYASVSNLEYSATEEFHSKDENEEIDILFGDRSLLYCDKFRNSKHFRDKMTESVIELLDSMTATMIDNNNKE